MIHKNMLIAVLVSFVLVLLLLTIWPSMEGNTENIGNEMAEAGGYEIDNKVESEVKNELWGIFIPIIFLAVLVMVFKEKRHD